MTYRLIIKPAAEADLQEAISWYEEQREGLGDEFLRAVEDVLEQVTETPFLFPIVRQHMRRAPARRFPYALFYVVEGDTVFLLGVFHGRRNPARWQERR